MPSVLQQASPTEQLAEVTRGAVDVHTGEDLKVRLAAAYDSGAPLTVKAGFDPTAPDLHLGHTVLLSRMRRFQEFGHKVIFVIGDFTGMIGDPTGKSATRPALTPEVVLKNAETYRAQVFRILDQERTEIRCNSEWLSRMTSRDMVFLAAKYPVARMLERDDFKRRYREGRTISIHEFLYPLLQGYDSVALKADVELGGTDQLFNLLVGRALMRSYELTPQIVITGPILEGVDAKLQDGKLVGEKMSKSLGNYIGINEPPMDIFSKLMSISDDLMWRYYELLSSRTSLEISVLKKNSHPMEAKFALAIELVGRYHSSSIAQESLQEWKRVHSKGEMPAKLDNATVHALDGKIGIAQLLTKSGLTSSNNEARRLVVQGAVSIGGSRVHDPQLELRPGSHLVRVGKKRFLQIDIV